MYAYTCQFLSELTELSNLKSVARQNSTHMAHTHTHGAHTHTHTDTHNGACPSQVSRTNTVST
jgi:hypothetical protein